MGEMEADFKLFTDEEFNGDVDFSGSDAGASEGRSTIYTLSDVDTDVESNMSVRITCSDGSINVDASHSILRLSQLLTKVLNDDSDDSDAGSDGRDDHSDISLPLIDKKTFERLMEFCEHRADPDNERFPTIRKPLESNFMKDIVPEWYADFINAIANDEQFIYAFIEGANYLDIEEAMKLGCAKLASHFRDRTVADIRQSFGIPDMGPMSDEEREHVLRSYPWVDAELLNPVNGEGERK